MSDDAGGGDRWGPSRPAPHRPAYAGVPDYLWTPAAAALLTLVCGLLGVATNQLWLFPSLGPTAFLLAHSPEQPAARAWNVVVGHLLALAAGYAALALFGGLGAPDLFAAHELAPVRVWASALAVALTLAAQLVTRSFHPPAAATTLLVALGGFRPTPGDAGAVVGGVLILAFAGGLLRRVHDELDLVERGGRAGDPPDDDPDDRADGPA